jgi:small basic protein
MTVLDKVFGGIHDFLQKLFKKASAIPEIVYQACNELYPIFSAVYADLQSNTANMIVTLIPGTLDDQVRNDLLLAIGAALTALGYVEGELQDKYAAFITANSTNTAFVKQALLVKALSLSASNLNSNDHPISVYDTAAQNTVFNHLPTAA